jgi:flavodoxin
MYRGVIIYAPAVEPMDQLVHRLRDCFDGERFKVKVLTADQASIPDLTAADLFLLGSLPEGRLPIHSDFTEILRALDGITLAGRIGGIFTLDSERTLTAFRHALQDCELLLSDENFRNVSAVRSESSDLSEWIAGLTRQLESHARGR